jgi:hypothetical protein
LKLKFGEELKKPVPEDFGLSTNQLLEIQTDNERVELLNQIRRRRRGAAIKLLSIALIIVAIFAIKYLGIFATIIILMWFGILAISGFASLAKYIYPDIEKSLAGQTLDSYRKKLSEYPEDKILKLREEERLLEIRRRETEYWFSLGGHEFEEEISNLFKRSGHFSVIKTKGSGDGGIDLILTANDGTKIVVQCKAHKAPIGPSIARDLYGAMHHEQVNRGIIVSLGGVTQGVRDFIEGKNISIIDVDGVIKMHKMLLVE